MRSLHATASDTPGSLDTLGSLASRRDTRLGHARSLRALATRPLTRPLAGGEHPGCRSPRIGFPAVQRPSPSAPRRVIRWGIGDFIWVWFAVIVATSLLVLGILQIVDPPPPDIGIAR